MDPHEWEQYEDRYRQRPETYDAYVDVWNRVSRARSLFPGWSLFSRMASAEPLLQRTQPERVREAEGIMRDAGYEIGEPTSRGARRWYRTATPKPAPPVEDPLLPKATEPDEQRPPGRESPATSDPPASEPVPRVADAPRSALVDELLRSAGFAKRCAELPRGRPDDERVAAALNVLVARGGVATPRAIAAACGLPEGRVRGFIAMLSRVLNVDGYGVLTVDESGHDVRLDLDLLRAQFELSEPR